MEVDGLENPNNISPKIKLRNEILDHLSKNTSAHFKSQQRNEIDLLESEKRAIAESVLNKSNGTFLSRFGDHLLEEHLDYFNDCPQDECYEVDFYLRRIRANNNKTVSKLKVRNRRFEALKKLVHEGSYFTEYEMKKRNPLLYEQLIGKFLTEEEENERTGVDTTSITFVNLLLEQYDRDQMKKLKEKQKEDEKQKEECFENGDEMAVDSQNDGTGFSKCNDDDDDCDNDETPVTKSLWGEFASDKDQSCYLPSSSKERSSPKRYNSVSQRVLGNLKSYVEVEDDENYEEDMQEEEEDMQEEEEDSVEEEEEEMSEKEKQLLMEEFRSSMFNSFLEGKDTDFNYSDVDRNSEYDDIDMRDLDEQDQYFNSESPENVESIINSDEGSNQGEAVNLLENSTVSESDKLVENSTDSISDETAIDNYVQALKDNENAESVTKKMEKLRY